MTKINIHRALKVACRQHGAATLVIVMALLLVVALLAAYANRGMLFEQRISTTTYRGAIAAEAMDSGVDWAIAMLNGGFQNQACQPATGGVKFRDRYLEQNPENRNIASLNIMSDSVAAHYGSATCYRDASTQRWTCSCSPVGSATLPAAPAATGTLQPGFSVGFLGTAVANVGDPFSIEALRSGVFFLRVRACSSPIMDLSCVTQDNQSFSSINGVGFLYRMIGFVSAVRTPPASPLTVRQSLITDGQLGLWNPDNRSTGTLLVYGTSETGLEDTRMGSLAGTDARLALVKDESLANLSEAEVFRRYMGMLPTRFPDHPAARTVVCTSTADCSGDISVAWNAGFRIMYINSDVQLTTALDIGTVTDPVVLVINGALTVNSATVQLAGLLSVSSNVQWTAPTTGVSVITGGVMAYGTMTTTGPLNLYYNAGVTDRLRNFVGSYVKIPNSWADITNGIAF